MILYKPQSILFVIFLVLGLPARAEPIPSDTLKNGLYEYKPGFDFIPGDMTYDLIADRLSCIEGEIPLTLNDRVYPFVNYFAVRDREYTKGVIQRKNTFFPIFEEYLEKYGLPDELKYLSIVESGLMPQSISRAGAGGLWQFMPYTGRSYGLHQDFYIDERFDPYRATEAACTSTTPSKHKIQPFTFTYAFILLAR